MTSHERTASLEWRGGTAFHGGAPGKPAVVVDGEGSQGSSPMEMLLLAAAGCTGADVVEILGKMRVALTRCRVSVTGIRRAEAPRRYVSLRFRYELAGRGLDETKARRAIDLSIEKYCSVLHTLAPDVATSYELDLG